MEYSPWGHKESGMTKEITHTHFTFYFLFIQHYAFFSVFFDYTTSCGISSLNHCIPREVSILFCGFCLFFGMLQHKFHSFRKHWQN